MAKPDNAYWLWVQPIEEVADNGTIKRKIKCEPPSPNHRASSLLAEYVLQEMLSLLKDNPELLEEALQKHTKGQSPVTPVSPPPSQTAETNNAWGQW